MTIGCSSAVLRCLLVLLEQYFVYGGANKNKTKPMENGESGSRRNQSDELSADEAMVEMT